MTSFTTKTIELLAPAKNAEIGIAAINCGADAVYIAAEKFSAREDAGNSLSDIQKLITHAHRYYARIYIALNTILRDHELPEALKLINAVYSLGADGLIIQDVGLLELPLPPMPLIASTQMHTDSLEKILFLQHIGFTRVILPRELSLAQITEIRARTSIELECFVHGSLCVSYSGQCYLSFALGGRSANRGACGQPCRRTYSLVNEKGTVLSKDTHLLSLKDLNRAADVPALLEAGITSFKIEGRLKDKAYVTNITSFYRKTIDALIGNKNIRRSSSGHTTFTFTPDPDKTFNRGYTDYGLNGKKEQFASLHTPKSVGEKIGTISEIGPSYFTLTTVHDLANGDGICFFDQNNVLRGTQINIVKDGKIYPDKMAYLTKKTVIYRNYDIAFMKTIEKVPCKRKIPVSFVMEESIEGFALTAHDEDENIGTYSLSVKKIIAEKKELAAATITSQLSMLNDTIFTCASILVTCKNCYFISRATLNQLRRGTIEDLLKNREKNRPQIQAFIQVNNIPYPVKVITYLGNCLNAHAKRFYERHGTKLEEWAAESGMDMRNKKVMTTLYCIKKELGLCGKDIGAVYLIDENNLTYPLVFDCTACLMEVYAPDKK